eukprot:m51a1_g3858 hypothetical protein (583) ;mRNA; r:402791-404728
MADDDDVRDVWWDNLLLLGFDAARESAAHGCAFEPHMFSRPSARGAEAVVAFLLSRVDPGRFRGSFRHCYPAYDAQQLREFRKGVSEWLRELERAGEVPLNSSSSTLLASPSGPRFDSLVWKLSQHALRVSAARDLRRPDVSCAPAPGAPDLPVRLLEARASGAARAFAERCAAMQRQRAEWARCALELSSRREELLTRARVCAEHLGEGEQRPSGGASATLAQKLRAAWQRTLSLAAEATELKNLVERDVQGQDPTRPLLDAAELGVRVPRVIQDALADNWDSSMRARDAHAAGRHRTPLTEPPPPPAAQPLYADEGKLDVVSLMQLSALSTKVANAEAAKYPKLTQDELRKAADTLEFTAAEHEHETAELRRSNDQLEAEVARLSAIVAALETEVDCQIEPAHRESKLFEFLEPEDDDEVPVPPRLSSLELTPRTPSKRASTGLPQTPSATAVRPEILEKLARSIKRVALKTNTPSAQLVETLAGTIRPIRIMTEDEDARRMGSTMQGVRRRLEFDASLTSRTSRSLTGTGRLGSTGTLRGMDMQAATMTMGPPRHAAGRTAATRFHAAATMSARGKNRL